MSEDKSFIEIIPTSDELTPQKVLEAAMAANLDYVLVIGGSDEGGYFASNDPDPLRAIVAAEKFRNFMMDN